MVAKTAATFVMAAAAVELVLKVAVGMEAAVVAAAVSTLYSQSDQHSTKCRTSHSELRTNRAAAEEVALFQSLSSGLPFADLVSLGVSPLPGASQATSYLGS